MDVEKSVDLSNIPQKSGKCRWKNSIGCTCNFIYGDLKGTIKIVDYKLENGKQSKIKIQYDNKEDWIEVSNFKKGSLGGFLKLHTKDFYYNIGDILHCNTDIEITDRRYVRKAERNRKLYTYKCLKCGQFNQTFEQNLKLLKGCPYCAGRIVKPGVNDITVTAPWMIGYFPGGTEEAQKYTTGSTVEIIPKCPICGRSMNKKMPINRLFNQHSCGCSCDTILSFGERIVYNLLMEINVDFIHEATASNAFPWAKKYRYDFYIPSHNMIIEVHGAQHYVEHGFGATMDGKTLEEEQENDKNKKELALNNGIDKYIALDCRKSKLFWLLNSIEESGLEEILNFKLENINQKNLMRQSYRSFQKQVLAVLKPGISLEEISKQTQISVFMLKRMIDLGLFSLQGGDTYA